MKMMNKSLLRLLLITWSLIGLTLSCTQHSKLPYSKAPAPENISQALPRVLYITTGIDAGSEDKDLPQAINTALQYFNRHGVPVHLSPRDICMI